jgi:hypothetical protein
MLWIECLSFDVGDAAWRSSSPLDGHQVMREDPGSRPYLERALGIATFEPGMYEVVQTFLPTGAPRPP